MMLDLLLAALVLQQPQTQSQAAALPPSPIADIVITPARGVLTPGDTIRFRAEPRDSAGQPITNARIMFRAAGGRFEGSVDTLGVVVAGATGTIPVAVGAIVPGTKPLRKRPDVRIVPVP